MGRRKAEAEESDADLLSDLLSVETLTPEQRLELVEDPDRAVAQIGGALVSGSLFRPPDTPSPVRSLRGGGFSKDEARELQRLYGKGPRKVIRRG